VTLLCINLKKIESFFLFLLINNFIKKHHESNKMIGNFWYLVNKIKHNFIVAAVSIVDLESIVVIKPSSKVMPLYDKYDCGFHTCNYPFAVCDMV